MKIKIKKKAQNSAPSPESCRECELLGRPKVVPFGKVDVQPIMIIKDTMDLDEDRTNPFNSESGRRLKRYLTDSGIGTDVRVIYSIKCKPMGVEPPSPACYKKCVSFVAREIEQFKPKFVLILGSGIVKPLLKIGFKRNKNCIVDKDGIQYMILDSLGSTVRKPSAQKLMEQNFERFKRLIDGKLENGSSFNYTTVYTPEQFALCLIDLEAEKTCISYDIETTGLKMYRPDVYLGTIGFGVEGKEWVIPFNHPDSPFTGQFRLQRQMYKLLLNAMKKAQKKGAALVAHNGKFDNKGLYYKFGEAPMMDDDTMLMSYNLDENEPNDLKNLSKIYCNANDYAIDATEILKFPLEVVAKYNAYDVHYTRRLWSIFKKKLAEDPITQKIYDHITFPASYSYQLAEIEGVPIDVKKLDEAIEENHDTVQGYLKELNRLYPQVLNWNSAQQVAKLLFEDLKMPILEKTKKGAPSISGESVLPRLIEYDPVIQVLLDYKKHLKLGQFLNGWKDELFEGKLFPSFLIHGTVTGRPSCKSPNLQQVPRDGSVRSLINITDPDWVVLEADYSQAELRIAAVMSEDPVMKMCFQTGIDVHLRTAAAVSGVSLEEVTKDMRKKAKGINFGYVYGMGAKKFQEYARDKYGVDMTMGQAVEARRAFFSLYNHLTPWHERQRALVHKFGYVRSIIGRKRRLPDIYSEHKGTMLEAERQSINSPVQGFGSDLDVISLNRITREVDRNNCRPFGTVHDAILMRVRRSALAEVVPQVAHIMSDTKNVERIFGCKPITVPIDTEIEAGAWGKGITVYEGGKVLDEVVDKIMSE